MVKFLKNNRKKIITGFMIVSVLTTLTGFTYSLKKDITVVVDGNPNKLVTYQKTFGSALKKSNITIGINDKVNKSLNANVTNNDVITINRAVNLKVFVDNKEINLKSSENDISSMLASQKITLGPTDKISPTVKSKLSSDMSITITRVKTETINQKKSIDFKTVIKKDTSLLVSKNNISQKGVNGEKAITTDITYEDGKEVTRKVKETIVKKPKNKIIVQGTKPAVTYSRGNLPSASGTSSIPSSKASGKTLYVKATAYWAFNGPNTYTASGTKAVRNPNGYSTIAVDPSVIPLGTKLYIEGYGNAIAADKGSSVKGNYIDVFFNTKQEAIGFGVKRLKVQILD
ncbi:MAG: 3D domain-containing protein [Clostridium sp.]|uniref:3D domain-containing protein n=1 Tax=Clostridium sp. TaxID=1506 RepID=UPI003D6CD0B0